MGKFRAAAATVGGSVKRQRQTSLTGATQQPAQQPQDTCINAKLQYHLAQCDSHVLSHKVFSGVADKEPTSLSGVPAYNAELAAEKLGAGQDYVASCPLFWLNMAFELQPNIPKYPVRVDNLQRHFFSEPCRFPKEVVVMTPLGGPLPHENKGALKAVCPPELRDAMRQAMAADAERNDVPRLREWLKFALSTPMRFVCVDLAEGNQLATIFLRWRSAVRTSG